VIGQVKVLPDNIKFYCAHHSIDPSVASEPGIKNQNIVRKERQKRQFFKKKQTDFFLFLSLFAYFAFFADYFFNLFITSRINACYTAFVSTGRQSFATLSSTALMKV